MNQSAILKKKGSNPNKAQSPLKNLDADMHYRSSVELVNTFEIKREHVANERNHQAKKEHAPTTHKRKNSEDFIPQQGNMKGQNKQRFFQFGESIQEKGIKLPMHNFRKSVLPATSVDQFLKKQQIPKEHDIDHDLPNKKEVKKKSVIPTTSLDQIQKQQGIVIGNERKQVNHIVADVEYMHAPYIHEHTKGLDDLEGQEEINGDECAIGEEVDIDCSTKVISKQKKVRGQTCKNIYARNLEEREEVTFDKGQAVGPTDKMVSELTNFIETIARNPRFINLMYTSWHAVPKDIKKRMWEYINSKFLNPVEGNKWVMIGLHDTWRRHKQKMKERFFYKNSTVEDMLAKHPDDIPEGELRQLIEYWKHPTVQRATKENNEEPSQCEMFIATCTKTGKEIQADTKVAIFLIAIAGTICSEGRLNFKIIKIPGKHLMMPLGQCLERSSLADLGLNVQDIPRVVGSNLVSPVDASSAQAVRGQHILHSSGSTHDSVLQKLSFLFIHASFGATAILIYRTPLWSRVY
ncbi:hypothetical protein KY290_035525 [Solanum tuberosum]|uniref:Uncharacterized protein n=1 Tax=Solanum tuberosum TaxID=4113 RepID=A0ABQ7U6B2_SOLTU|nr:hypothetical protein KY289_034723 [Solanum tuberosum]KAH0647589.1 hypothetical protein KY285_032837 [Solanum tuberosum]KAH0742482.1 hypothetical protein KY290_035525 [Solanum tuberosum]